MWPCLFRMSRHCLISHFFTSVIALDIHDSKGNSVHVFVFIYYTNFSHFLLCYPFLLNNDTHGIDHFRSATEHCKHNWCVFEFTHYPTTSWTFSPDSPHHLNNLNSRKIANALECYNLQVAVLFLIAVLFSLCGLCLHS